MRRRAFIAALGGAADGGAGTAADAMSKVKTPRLIADDMK